MNYLGRGNCQTIEVSIDFLDQGIGPEFIYTLLSSMSIKKLYVTREYSARLSEMEIVSIYLGILFNLCPNNCQRYFYDGNK